jgi:hypothetical protein
MEISRYENIEIFIKTQSFKEINMITANDMIILIYEWMK